MESAKTVARKTTLRAEFSPITGAASPLAPADQTDIAEDSEQFQTRRSQRTEPVSTPRARRVAAGLVHEIRKAKTKPDHTPEMAAASWSADSWPMLPASFHVVAGGARAAIHIPDNTTSSDSAPGMAEIRRRWPDRTRAASPLPQQKRPRAPSAFDSRSLFARRNLSPNGDERH